MSTLRRNRRRSWTVRRLARVGTAAVAGVTLVAGLAGCGVRPDAAAVVGNERISLEEVDAAAEAVCAANVLSAEAQGQPTPQLASRGARLTALQLLVDNELSEQFAEARGIEPSMSAVSQIVDANTEGVPSLPPESRAAFDDLLRGFAESQVILRDAGATSIGDAAQVSPEQLAAEGARLRQQWARGVTVQVDPRFGEWEQGTLSPGSGSLSIPVSQDAVAGANPNPATDFVAALPPSQRC